jgi:two-component system, cell cycle response regulator
MRVVLVDPSRTVLKAISRLLEVRNHTVLPFVDGRAALACIKSDIAVDAVITSAELPTISGFELCWEAKLLATSSRCIYVILMSSTQDRRKLIEALDCGADDFIGKPPMVEELYARLRAAERLASMQRELVRLASTDSLTGVPNRRAFLEMAQEACASVDLTGTLCAVMVDIDNFKRINDCYGHDIGDRAIQGVARALANENAILGRLGGEEFAIVLERQCIADAIAVAERLRVKTGTLQFETDKGVLTLTCSFGVSEWKPSDTIDQLLKRADLALYEAKSSGRNRVVAADDALELATYADWSVVRAVAH